MMPNIISFFETKGKATKRNYSGVEGSSATTEQQVVSHLPFKLLVSWCWVLCIVY